MEENIKKFGKTYKFSAQKYKIKRNKPVCKYNTSSFYQ